MRLDSRGGRWRWLSPALAAVVTIALGLAGSLATSTVQISGWRRPAIWAVVVVLAIVTVAAAVHGTRTRPLPGKPAQLGEDGEAILLRDFIARELALAEDRLRPISARNSLQVRWKLASAAQSVTAGERSGWIRQPGGGFEEICRVFSGRSRPQRVVFLGDAGAGKTILVTQLVKQLLVRARELQEHRGAQPTDTLIPFYVSAASWDSGGDIVSWIGDQLARTYPQLGSEVARGAGDRMADDWLKHRVLPIIDGLDELPNSLRVKAIADINDRAELPVVVTSRPQEYMDAFDAVGRSVSGSIVLDLNPLDISEVENYLLHTTAIVPAGRWDDVFIRLNNDGEDPLKDVLTNPLMLWLASRVYEAKSSFPGELANSSCFGDRETIELHLLGEFVPAIYSHREGAHRSHWTPEQARRYLAFLAYHAERTRSPDLAWWRLTRAVRGWRPIGVAARAMLLFGVAWWLIAWLVQIHPGWRRSFPAEMLFAGGPLGRQVVPLARYLKELNLVYMPVDGRWLRTAGDYIPWQSLASLEVWVALLALGTGSWSAIRVSRHRNTLRVVRIRSLSSLGGAGISLAMAAVLAGLILLGVSAIGRRPVFRLNGRVVMEAPFPLHSALVLLVFVILWLLKDISSNFVHRIDKPGLVDPSGVLRSDRHATSFAALLPQMWMALAIWLYFGLLIAVFYAFFSAASFTCRSLLGGLRTASDQFSDARIWLACRRCMPWTIMAFLADASKRGVLRQSGAVYQFRHIRLRQELSALHPRVSRGLTKIIVRMIRSCRPARKLVGQWSPPSVAPWAEPFWALRLEEFAVTELSGGCIPGQIRTVGPGYAQSFTGTEDGQSWMICALPGEEPVKVAVPIWQALRNAASQAMRDAECAGTDNLLTSIGFPASGVNKATETRVALRGGSWGNGLLMRADDGSWRWKPSWPFREPYAGCFDSWDQHGAQLRLSARVYFFWQLAHLIVSPETYEMRPDQLTVASLPQAVTEMWTRRGGGMPQVKWTWSGLSGKRRVGLLWTVTSHDKRPVMTGDLSLSIVRIRRHFVIWSEAQFCIEDTAAWRDSLQAISGRHVYDDQLRLSLDELTAYLSAAWYTAAETLPRLVVENPFGIYPKYPPRIELTLSTDSRNDEMLNRRDLRNRIDFSPSTRRDDSQLTHMSADIVGQLQLNNSERTKQINAALISMMLRAGFDSN